MADDWLKIRDEVTRAFGSGSVYNASAQDLQRYLQNICTGAIPNETIRHQEIVRGITINHIQMARVINDLKDTMAKLNAANDRTQRFVLVLTIVAVIVGAIQAVAAVISIMR